jgi:hypothetical protein
MAGLICKTILWAIIKIKVIHGQPAAASETGGKAGIFVNVFDVCA